MQSVVGNTGYTHPSTTQNVSIIMTNSRHDKQGTKYDASSVLDKQLSELCVTGLGITQSIMLMVMLGKNDKPTLPT